MMRHGGLFEVWLSRGTGLEPGPRFRLLDDARRYVACHVDASYAIRSPDGHWETFDRAIRARGTRPPANVAARR
jgi:hypothetical protein